MIRLSIRLASVSVCALESFRICDETEFVQQQSTSKNWSRRFSRA
jgi:hypothetical protein